MNGRYHGSLVLLPIEYEQPVILALQPLAQIVQLHYNLAY